MRQFSLNANQLKIIAIIAMVIDHAAGFFLPAGPLKIVLRTIGRLTAPIMCYMIAEGYFHTSNRMKYLGRLLLFAVISHLPFNYCMGFSLWPWHATSVIWALAMGLLALMIVKNEKLHPLLRIGGLGLCCLLAYTANFNYVAVLWVVVFGWFRGKRKMQMIAFAVVGTATHLVQSFMPLLTGAITVDRFQYWFQLGIFLVIPLLLCYDGTLGKKSKFLSRFFYWFYPVHIVLLYLIKQLIA